MRLLIMMADDVMYKIISEISVYPVLENCMSFEHYKYFQNSKTYHLDCYIQ